LGAKKVPADLSGAPFATTSTGAIMLMSTNSINDAMTSRSAAANKGEAGVVEGHRGNAPFTIELLLNATQRERESLEDFEESINALRLSLEQRRRVIDQQEEILRDLSESLSTRRR